MHDSRLRNLLGAAGLAVADLTREAVDEAGGRHPSWSAALITLAREPGTATTDLARHIRVTQPAASRLIDGLEASGLIERETAHGRSVPLRLTPDGEAAVRRLLDARHETLDDVLAPLDADERATLERLLEKVLDGAYDRVRSTHVMCRLCDHVACTRDDATCPVSHARRERGATT